MEDLSYLVKGKYEWSIDATILGLKISITDIVNREKLCVNDLAALFAYRDTLAELERIRNYGLGLPDRISESLNGRVRMYRKKVPPKNLWAMYYRYYGEQNDKQLTLF